MAKESYGAGMRYLALILAVGLIGTGCGDARTDGGPRTEGQLPGDCSDGADNDVDGMFDCDDNGCVGAPACSEGGTSDAQANDGSSLRDGGAQEDGATTQGDAGIEARAEVCHRARALAARWRGAHADQV